VTPPIQNAAMPPLEPLPTVTLVAIGALLATVVALWLRPWWLWTAAASLTILAAYVAGILDGPAGLTFALLAFALLRFRASTGVARAGYGAIVAVVSLLLALHVLPGFHNPLVIRDAVLSAGALPYRQHANIDKGLAGVLILGVLGFARLPAAADRRDAVRRAGPIVAVTIAGVMAASLALGFVRVDPRWTPVFWAWAPINLLLTCVSEEAFFRGFLQREAGRLLDGRPHAAAVAVAASAILFGLAHAAGGRRYVVLATLAGTGYALAYQRTGRIEAAVLAHFAVNATHFLLFTYPALA
jgi:membrane protease YdiL (CAAX protease family)